MTLLSAPGAESLRDYGVTRFVPARELTIEEIKKIRQETSLELEVFVHGALCYCYSGQCLMSSMIGGRSGNHGMCAGPCRLTYESDQAKGHLLSPKDVCTLAHIPELVDAGIDSFKIEGRMKQTEYVALTTYYYRKYVDLYEARGKEYYDLLCENPDSELHRDEKNLMDVFNRGGFCGGYLFEKKWEDIIYPDKCNHFGLKVGEVSQARDRSVDICLCEDIQYQDVLDIRDEHQNSVYEYTVKNPATKKETVTANVLKGLSLQKGMSVYRRKNTQLLTQCQEISQKDIKIGLNGEFTGHLDQPAKLSVSAGNIQFIAEGPIGQPAQNRQVTKEDVLSKLDSIGNTEYKWDNLTAQMDSGMFYPLKELKQLRRQAIAGFEQQVLNRFHGEIKPQNAYPTEVIETKNELHVLVSTLEQLECVLEANVAERIYLRFDKVEDFRKGVDLCPNCFIRIPLVTTDFTPYEWMNEHPNIAGVLIGSHEQYAYFSTHMKDKIWVADANMYTTNTYAREFYRKRGVYEFTAPYDQLQVNGIHVVYGYVPVMTTKGCLNRGTKYCRSANQVKFIGERGDEFVCVTHCEQCVNTIYYLPNRPPMDETGVRRLDFTIESIEEMKEVLDKWKR